MLQEFNKGFCERTASVATMAWRVPLPLGGGSLVWRRRHSRHAARIAPESVGAISCGTHHRRDPQQRPPLLGGAGAGAGYGGCRGSRQRGGEAGGGWRSGVAAATEKNVTSREKVDINCGFFMEEQRSDRGHRSGYECKCQHPGEPMSTGRGWFLRRGRGEEVARRGGRGRAE